MTKLTSYDLRSLLTASQFAEVQEHDDQWIQEAIGEKLKRDAWLKENSVEAKAIRRISEPISDQDWIELPETTEQEYHEALQGLKAAGYNVNVPIKN